MRRLHHLPGDSFKYFAAIVDAKHSPRKSRLIEIKPRIEEYYRKFVTDPSALTVLNAAEFTADLKGDLCHCYTNSTRPLEQLKADIDEHLRKTCPIAAAMCQYCGLTHAPSSFDHYVPKELFPEYATHSHNLVPSCERCNTLKGSAWLGAGNEREIISFYFDTLPKNRFLHADIQMAPGPTAQFRLSTESSDFDGLEAVIRAHFKKIRLLDRYKLAAPAEFSERIVELASVLRDLGQVAATNLLRKKAEQTTEANSPNYWKVALLHAMADSEAFIDWCGRPSERTP
jgi:5-methylcytosine-specific restriction endonuclease McrA